MESITLPLPKIHENEQEETSEGPLYQVIIHNDKVTPMDFVIDVLINIFCLPESNAASVMYTAHLNDSAYVQTLPRPEAQNRINKAHFAAAMKNYPLKFTLERE